MEEHGSTTEKMMTKRIFDKYKRKKVRELIFNDGKLIKRRHRSIDGGGAVNEKGNHEKLPEILEILDIFPYILAKSLEINICVYNSDGLYDKQKSIIYSNYKNNLRIIYSNNQYFSTTTALTKLTEVTYSL